MSEAEQKQTLHEKAVRVDWHFPDNLVSKYANNVFIQQGQADSVIDEEEEEHEWHSIVSKPHVREALRRMAIEARRQIAAGEIEEGGFAIE